VGEPDRGHVAHAVAEAIDAHAAPQVRNVVVRMALRAAGCGQIPERGPEATIFVRGALFQAMEELLGADTAAAIRDELAPLLGRMDVEGEAEITHVRPTWPGLDASKSAPDFPIIELDEPEPEERHERITAPAPGNMPIVLVASADPATVSALAGAMAGAGLVEPVRDAIVLLDALETASVVVLDCRYPSVRAETMIAVEPDLPRGTRVVLWGDPPSLDAQLSSIGAKVPKEWIRCGREATADDVATICRVLAR
jgi:hypothetical protein